MWLGLVRGHGWQMKHLDVATTVYHRIPATASMTGAAAATVAGVRRFAAGHRLLTSGGRWRRTARRDGRGGYRTARMSLWRRGTLPGSLWTCTTTSGACQ